MSHIPRLTSLAAAIGALILPAGLAAAGQQLVDCVAAEVNNQAITLTDVRIIRGFDLLRDTGAGGRALTPLETLQQIIDQQVVVGLVRQGLPIAAEDVEARLKSLKARFEPAEWERRLGEFGITDDGLRSYLEDALQFERLITIRFGQTADISVKEIQDYYEHEYVPAEKAAGREAKPMVQALNEIEERIRDRKRESQVSVWVQSLRSQAEIRVHTGCLDQLK